jgi:NADH:ubiquinone oxidoreductase subunit D
MVFICCAIISEGATMPYRHKNHACTYMYVCIYVYTYTGHTQENDAVLIVFTIKTGPFFCVRPVHTYTSSAL